MMAADYKELAPNVSPLYLVESTLVENFDTTQRYFSDKYLGISTTIIVLLSFYQVYFLFFMQTRQLLERQEIRTTCDNCSQFIHATKDVGNDTKEIFYSKLISEIVETNQRVSHCFY